MRSSVVSRWIAFPLFALLAAAVAAYAIAYLFLPFRAGDPFAMQFAISGIDVPAHFFLGGVALLLAPLQLSASARRAAPGLHRMAGWLYAGTVLFGGIAALSLAPAAQGGLPSRLGFGILGVFWIAVTANGIRHAVAGDFVRHRAWMARSIALTWSAVTLRLMLGIGVAAGLPFLDVYVFAAWGSWLLNLAVCEWLLHRRAAPRRAVAATRSASCPPAA